MSQTKNENVKEEGRRVTLRMSIPDDDYNCTLECENCDYMYEDSEVTLCVQCTAEFLEEQEGWQRQYEEQQEEEKKKKKKLRSLAADAAVLAAADADAAVLADAAEEEAADAAADAEYAAECDYYDECTSNIRDRGPCHCCGGFVRDD
jgi:hypothetical protein